MPTNRTRRTRGIRQDKGYTALSEARMQYLFFGFDMYDHHNSMWKDEAEIKLCWERNREQVMEKWQNDKCNKGKRPWAWWHFEKKTKAPLTLAGSPKEAEALMAMGELQESEYSVLNESISDYDESHHSGDDITQ